MERKVFISFHLYRTYISLRIPLLQHNILYTCKGAFIENFNDHSMGVWLYMHASDYEVSRSRVIELHALYILQLKL